MKPLLPTVKFGDTDITRLIIGGNPFSGNSHVSPEMDREMETYFTTANMKKALFDCMENGINTMQLRADRHILRLMHEFRCDGGRLHWIAQTASEMSLEVNIPMIRKGGAVAVYHHGSVTDSLYQAGEIAQLRSRLDLMRSLDMPLGLGTHIPEVVRRAEEENWGVDFYMTCLYNLSKQDRISSAITGISNQDEPFDEEDRDIMLETVRWVDKPCLVFKILGATRRCATPEDVRAAFAEAYHGMKPIDAGIVGMYPKDSDQVAENAEIVRELCRGE